ncbi:MAG TPA: response regulator [Ktedonobacterales bacterium]|jgi:DNA-binding response OmpR family regulator
MARTSQALIVEDENPLRRILTLNLARRGYNIVEADTGEAALDALRIAVAAQLPFDLILLDINLPDLSGWDVLRRLRDDTSLATRPPPAVIVMTAVRPHEKRIAEFHPNAVLLKPFPIDAVLRLSDRVLAKQPAAREEVEDG